MDPIPAAVAVGTLSVLGHWAEKKPLSINTAIGVAAIAIVLTAMHGMNPALASAFGILVVTAVAMAHAPKIMAKIDI